jgi:hypothetical protein
MRAFALLLLGSGWASACGGSPLSASADGAAAADGATAADVAAPADVVAPADVAASDATTSDGSPTDGDGREAAAACPPALASASELASTPRADVNLELVALKLSPGKIVADEATYRRVVRDVGAIRGKYPEVATISFFPIRDGRSINFVLPVATAEQMQAGTYHAWDCLNDTYGAVLPFEFHRIGNAADVIAFGKLKGIYAMDLLAAEYARLPGITSTGSIAVGGDGSTICVTSGPSTWHYVFDDASGDCPAGCIDHSFRHFTTDTDGAVTALEAWSTQSGTPRPAWVTQLVTNATCH